MGGEKRECVAGSVSVSAWRVLLCISPSLWQELIHVRRVLLALVVTKLYLVQDSRGAGSVPLSTPEKLCG